MRLDDVDLALRSLGVPSARDFTASPDAVREFAAVGDPESVRRAAYFKAVAHALAGVLTNPFEPLAGTIEPAHPWRAGDVQERFLRAWPAELAVLFGPAGLSLLSPELWDAYPGRGIVGSLLPAVEEGYLLHDPYYDVVSWRDDGRTRERPLAGVLAAMDRHGLPQTARIAVARSPGAALMEGSLVGNVLFGDVLREIRPGAYQGPDVPDVAVGDIDELRSVVDALRPACTAAGGQLWFRGQGTDFLMPDRGALAREGIAEHSEVRDSLLVPGVYRAIDGHTEDLEAYERFIGSVVAWTRAASETLGRPYEVGTVPAAGHPSFAVWETRRSIDGRPGEMRQWDPSLRQVQQGMLLQHYGCPTPWIDITTDPLIGAWFAVNRCTEARGALSFAPMDWEDGDPAAWPTIFVFPLIDGTHPVLDTGTLLKDSTALRPVRQRCGLLGGAGSHARNYAARFLALKIRLRPGFPVSLPVTGEDLFPGPDEDRLLASLLADESLMEGPYPVTELSPA